MIEDSFCPTDHVGAARSPALHGSSPARRQTREGKYLPAKIDRICWSIRT
jgi:hypothetical protein